RFDKMAVLKYERYFIHQCFFWNVTYVDISYQYASLLRVKKSCNDICKRCLAAAGCTHQCYRLSGLYEQRYVIKCVFSAVIAVADVFQCDGIVIWHMIYTAFRQWL